MRSMISVAVLSLLTMIPARGVAGNLDAKAPDPQSIAALEARAVQAQPREQCFLYAQLLHEMTEYSVAQYASGESEKGSSSLQKIEAVAKKIHLAVSADNKRLKDAEILLRHTAFRLKELLQSSSVEDHPLVQRTLFQVNAVESEAMMQVFRK